jgi:hypothetical protein
MLDFFNSISGIVSFVGTIISWILAIIFWKLPASDNRWGKIRPKLRTILLFIGVFFAGYFVISNIKNFSDLFLTNYKEVHLEELPYSAKLVFPVPKEINSNNLGLDSLNLNIYSSGEGQRVYKLDYFLFSDFDPKIPPGLYFTFPKEQDFSKYKYVVSVITYGCECIFTDLVFVDISGNQWSTTLGLNQVFPPGGIAAETKDYTQTVRIPLSPPYDFRMDLVSEIRYIISNTTQLDYKYFYVEDLYFTNKSR